MFKVTLTSFSTVRFLVVLIFILNVFFVLSGVAFYLDSLKTLKVSEIENRINVALNVEKEKLRTAILEYSFWDATYENTVKYFNKKWIDHNIGGYAVDKYGLDILLIANESGHVFFKKFLDNKLEIKKNDFDSLILKSKKLASTTKEIDDYICISGDAYLVAVAPMVDQQSKEVRKDRSYVFFGKKISTSYVRFIEVLYQLPSLHLSYEQNPQPPYVFLNVLDCPFISLSCSTPSVLNREKFSLILPWLSMFLIMTIGLLWFILSKHNDLRDMQEKKIYNFAIRDSLTNVFNRRHFYELGILLFKEKNLTIWIFMIDIDYFKSINDQYGHAMGDKVLRFFAEILKDCLRESDILGRLGGEEFAAILTGGDKSNAHSVAERIRRKVQSSHTRDITLPKITVSIGVGQAVKGDRGFEETLRLADDALYQAKKSGRNKVVFAAED